MQRLRDKESPKAELVHGFLKYLYANFDKELRNYPNIEDFLNLLRMAKTFNRADFMDSTLWPSQKIEKVYDVTLKAVTDLLWDSMQRKESLQPVRDFAAYGLAANDVVITFNWDTTIERAIWDDPRGIDIDYSYSRTTDEKTIWLLKPHGSIDWFRKSDLPKEIPKQDLIPLESGVCVYKRFNLAKNPKLRQSKPLIVPPISEKQFDNPLWKAIWGQVFKAMSDATELVIIGYSLPKEDQFARLVFRRAIRNNLIKAEKQDKPPLKASILNPDEGAEVTFSRLIGRKVKSFSFMQTYFEDYVSALQERSLE